jgi:hypothetical protein
MAAGMFDIYTAYLGHRPGLYASLAMAGGCTSGRAGATDGDERAARPRVPALVPSHRPGLPTSAAAQAGRASVSPSATRACASMDSTSTRRRYARPGKGEPDARDQPGALHGP